MRHTVHIYFEGLYAFLAHMASDRGRRANGEAIVFRDGGVYDATAAARACGVRLGMKRGAVERLTPRAAVYEHDARSLSGLLRPVWSVVWEFTPWIETRGREVFFALTGSEPSCELRKVLVALDGLYPAREWRAFGGIAANKLVARMAARAAYLENAREVPVLRVGRHSFAWVREVSRWMLKADLRELWTLPGEVRERLERLGIRRASELVGLPLEEVQSRLGFEASLWQMYARGEDHSPLRANFPPVARAMEWRGAGEGVPLSTFMSTAQRLTEQLAQRLEREGAGAGRLFLHAGGEVKGGHLRATAESDAVTAEEPWLVRAGSCELEVGFSKPMFSVDRLWPRVERCIYRLPLERVRSFVMTVSDLRPLSLRQLSWEWREDALCDPLGGRRTDLEELCEEVRMRFSAQALRKGCVRSPREARLLQVDPFRGGIVGATGRSGEAG